jgi:hypothetical protein
VAAGGVVIVRQFENAALLLSAFPIVVGQCRLTLRNPS